MRLLLGRPPKGFATGAILILIQHSEYILTHLLTHGKKCQPFNLIAFIFQFGQCTVSLSKLLLSTASSDGHFQGSCETLVNCLAYIDLNPLRAGRVERPDDYRWNSLGYHLQTEIKTSFYPPILALKSLT
jgi:hypothetical protein